MLKKIISLLRGYDTLDASALNVSQQGSELVLRTDRNIPAGTKVRVTLPDGEKVFGHASWQRDIPEARNERLGLLLGVALTDGRADLTNEASKSGVRAHERHELRQWVSFPRLKGLGCVTTDLSIEGCRLDVSLQGRIGETHLIELELPRSQRRIGVQAKILWSSDGATGLRFLNMHIQDEACLARDLGYPTHPAQETWESVWRRSLDAMTYRVTRKDDQVVTIDFETPNWLVTYELKDSQIRGEWTGAFTEVVTFESSPQLLALQQSLGLDIDRPRSLIHLKLLRAGGEAALTIWGVEHAFQRIPRRGTYSSSSPSHSR